MALTRSAPPVPAAAPAAPADPDTLRHQLATADTAGRRAAARALAALPEAAAWLGEHLVGEPELSVRAVVFSSLSRIGGAGAVDALLPLLRSQDAALRNGAIEALAGMPQAVAPRVQQLLADDDGDVRIFAVNLLGQLPHPEVPRWLARVLQEDDAPNVVGAALDVAAEVAGAELDGPLRVAVARFPADPFIAFAADLVLRRIAATA